jgi:hypothetical protein
MRRPKRRQFERMRRPGRRGRQRQLRLGLGNGPTGPVANPPPATSQSFYLPVPYAQQVFSLVPAAAGVLGGLLLAQKFATAKATHVKASEIVTASVLSFAASFAVVFLIKSFKSYDDEDDAGGADVDADVTVGVEA